MSMQQARDSLADLVSMVRWTQQTVEITKYNKPVAYLVGPEWFERASHALAQQNPG